MKSKLIAVAIAVLIAVVFYILMLLVDDPNHIFASSFVFGLSLSLLMGRSFKHRSTAKQIDDAFKKAIAREQRQGGQLRYK